MAHRSRPRLLPKATRRKHTYQDKPFGIAATPAKQRSKRDVQTFNFDKKSFDNAWGVGDANVQRYLAHVHQEEGLLVRDWVVDGKILGKELVLSGHRTVENGDEIGKAGFFGQMCHRATDREDDKVLHYDCGVAFPYKFLRCDARCVLGFANDPTYGVYLGKGITPNAKFRHNRDIAPNVYNGGIFTGGLTLVATKKLVSTPTNPIPILVHYRWEVNPDFCPCSGCERKLTGKGKKPKLYCNTLGDCNEAKPAENSRPGVKNTGRPPAVICMKCRKSKFNRTGKQKKRMMKEEKKKETREPKEKKKTKRTKKHAATMDAAVTMTGL